MKKLVLLLVVLLVALPVAALAHGDCPPEPPVEPGACTSIFQAYGDYAGSYSVGCQTIEGAYQSHTSSSTKVDCLANACPTQYPDMVAATNCNGGGQTCVLNVTVRERNSSDITAGTFNSQLAVGSASGQMFGSASVCGDPSNFSKDTGFTQTLTTYSQASFDPCYKSDCAAVSGSGFASGSQTFIAAPR